MTNTTKTLLGISLTAFAFGITHMLWGVGTPLGAVFLGLFMISKILEKETALFDEEEQLRITLAEGNRASAPKRQNLVRREHRGRSQLSAARHSS